MQHTARFTPTELALYHQYLQSDHDYTVWADILTLEEKYVGTVDLLDGQVNFTTDGEGPDRTGSVVLSDPEGALAFGTQYARDDTDTLWVNRLIQVNHQVIVPTLGEVISVAMLGVPTTVARKGGEIGVELVDKSLLADHGVRPRNFKKGARVDKVLRAILRDETGERRLSIPPTKKTLSRNYSIGMGENSLTPWQAFKQIAGREMGWRAFYSADGVATCEATNAKRPVVQLDHVLSLPDASTSFTDFSNYVKVTSNRRITVKEGGKKTGATQIREGVAVLPRKHDLSEQSLSRHGVPRTLPLVVNDNDLKSQKQVNKKARSELQKGSKVKEASQTYEIMPFFHLDNADHFKFPKSTGIGEVEFDRVSLPLGTSGNMSLGEVKWVSRPVKVKRVRSKKTIHRDKKKGGKKNG